MPDSFADLVEVSPAVVNINTTLGDRAADQSDVPQAAFSDLRCQVGIPAPGRTNAFGRQRQRSPQRAYYARQAS